MPALHIGERSSESIDNSTTLQDTKEQEGDLIVLASIIRWKPKSAQSVWMDQSSCFIERVEPETEAVAPVLPRHPKSYMEIMEMIQRGERPGDIQDINDDPPNPDQPISKPRMAPKPKPWEKQDQEDCTGDLKSLSSDSGELGSEVQNTNQSTESASGPNQEDSLLQAEVVEVSESPANDDASSK
ncbi:hypothetical protein PR202_ga06061 [Eleusine coracana subsp. coracana]|uniref:Peroxisomal membrane protein PEX14 n=1 Tax=Eleusine coracana subsp. coracana TaxID=191504 RepID=A0AAV5BVN8_ELECO|nr:hypothetical protein PR202_ga06061 [Eleusine coracana subsp. coracana]